MEENSSCDEKEGREEGELELSFEVSEPKHKKETNPEDFNFFNGEVEEDFGLYTKRDGKRDGEQRQESESREGKARAHNSISLDLVSFRKLVRIVLDPESPS